jgi:hypothetical protein
MLNFFFDFQSSRRFLIQKKMFLFQLKNHFQVFFKSFLYCLILFFSPSLMAFESQQLEELKVQLKENVRSYLVQILGEKGTSELIGLPPDKIQLPIIPKLSLLPRNSASYEKRIDQGKSYQLNAENIRFYNVIFVNEIYKRTFHREATDGEKEKWLNTLEQGGSREGIFRALVFSTEYNQLERNSPLASPRAESFAVDFLNKYINYQIKQSSLGKYSATTWKRVCVDKALDMMDVISQNPNDLYRWYAVLSSQWGKNFGDQFSAQLRKGFIREEHFNWAQTVPLDIIKAEVILKMFIILDFLDQGH